MAAGHPTISRAAHSARRPSKRGATRDRWRLRPVRVAHRHRGNALGCGRVMLATRGARRSRSVEESPFPGRRRCAGRASGVAGGVSPQLELRPSAVGAFDATAMRQSRRSASRATSSRERRRRRAQSRPSSRRGGCAAEDSSRDICASPSARDRPAAPGLVCEPAATRGRRSLNAPFPLRSHRGLLCGGPTRRAVSLDRRDGYASPPPRTFGRAP